MATHTLPTTEARRRFLSLVKDAGEAFSRYVVTYRGKPEAVLMSAEEFEGWLETLEIAQSPSWRKALARARKEDRPGNRLGLEAATKPGQKTRAR